MNSTDTYTEEKPAAAATANKTAIVQIERVILRLICYQC